MRTPATFLALAALALTVGCAVEDNLRLTIGESVPIANLPPVMPDTREGPAGSADHASVPGDAPSLTGLDRTGFEASEFRVPIDGVAHQPSTTLPLTTRTEHARHRGEFPTMETVNEQSDQGSLARLSEMVTVHAWNLVETLWIVPALIIDPAWETVYSPAELQGRTSAKAPMLTPGVITLTAAELDDLRSASSIDDMPKPTSFTPAQPAAEEPAGE